MQFVFSRLTAQDTLTKIAQAWTKQPIQPETPLSQVMDSLDTLEVLMSIEDEFNINIPDEVAESVLSINDYLNYLSTVRSPANPSAVLVEPATNDNLDPKST